MIAQSHSRSELLRRVLFGPLVSGDVYGRGRLRFGDYVVIITRPGSARMPNGIECDVQARRREKVAIGGGRLLVGQTEISPGPSWDPVPIVRRSRRVLPAGPEPLLQVSPGRGSRTMSTGDCVLAGYLAGLVLIHGQRERSARLAVLAAARLNPLSATMLRHAALGEVPEPVHRLLSTGDSQPLLSTADMSGASWLRGMVSAGYLPDFDTFWGRAAGGATALVPDRG
jgi:hypothetical protein